jgi:hypothetical protein
MKIVRIPFYKKTWIDYELHRNEIDKSKPFKVWRDLYTFEFVFEQD